MEFSEQFKTMEAYIAGLQKRICADLEKLDGKKFHTDLWKRQEGGGGRSNILLGGNVFEKAGVNISSVHGILPQEIASHLGKKEMNFFACGLSLVIHPESPRIPTIHLNIRYFEMEDQDAWFGGGVDLTPYYPHEEDFISFHKGLRDMVEGILPGHYQKYKAECDRYFMIRHRAEMRGIGGIFFDYLKKDLKLYFRLVKAVGENFSGIYLPIVLNRRKEKFTQDDKHFQLIRRGRYVEFNLLYDRGTLFGLKTNGRVESILMSLPPYVAFPYTYTSKNPVHQRMVKFYQPTDWIE